MSNQNQFTNSTNSSIQGTMENIWRTTCGSWENCNESTVQSFLSQCEQHNIDPQFCMSWIQQHSEQIPNWSAVSDTTREWVNQHTSSGSHFAIQDEDLS